MIEITLIFPTLMLSVLSAFGGIGIFHRVMRRKTIEDNLPYIDEVKNFKYKKSGSLIVEGPICLEDIILLHQYPDGRGYYDWFRIKSIKPMDSDSEKYLIKVDNGYYDWTWAREPLLWDPTTKSKTNGCKLVAVGKETGAELYAFIRSSTGSKDDFCQSLLLKWEDSSKKIWCREIKLTEDININTDPDYLYELMESKIRVPNGWSWNKDWTTGKKIKWYRTR